MSGIIKTDDFNERGRKTEKPRGKPSMSLQDTWASPHIRLVGQENPAHHKLVVDGNVLLENPDGWLLTNIEMDILLPSGRMMELNKDVASQTGMSPRIAERMLPYPFMSTTQAVLSGIKVLFFPRGEFTPADA